MRCQKNKHGHNFQNIASKTNQHWVIVYDLTLIYFGPDMDVEDGEQMGD